MKVKSQIEVKNEKGLRDNFRQFFITKSFPLLKSYDRNIAISLILLFIKHVQYIQMQVPPYIQNELVNKDHNSNFIKHFMFIFNDRDLQMYFLYASLALNSLLLLVFFIYLAYFLILKKIDPKNRLLSFFFQVYYYAFLISSLMLSFNQASEFPIPSYINLIISLAIMFIQGMHEYDFRFVTKDFLSSRSVHIRQIIILMEISVLILQALVTEKSEVVINFIFFTLLFILDLVYVPYLNRTVQIINTAGQFYQFIFSLNILLEVNVVEWNIFNLFSALLIPISFKIACRIHDTKKHILLNRLMNRDRSILFSSGHKQIDNQNSRSYQPFIVDYYLRSMYSQVKLDFDDYLSSQTSLVLEELISSHQMYCFSPQYCFCSKDYDEKDRTIRCDYLYDYIERYYENEIKKSKKTNILHFSYLQFLLDAQENPNKCFVKVFQLLNKLNKGSIMTMQMINNIMESSNKKLSYLNKSQSYQTKDSSQQQKYIDFINFDADINQCYSFLRECLEMKKQTIQQVGQDQIDLDAISLQFQVTRNKRNEIYKILNSLVQQPISNPQLSFLIEIYERSLSFDNELSMIKKRVQQSTFRINKALKTSNIYDFNYCSVFISLTNLGQVKKVTNNFEKVVPIYSNNESIGKNINFMLPPAVAQVHNKILNSYLTKQSSRNFHSRLNPIIGVDKQGWAIPYDIKLQPCQIEQQDFGVSASIKQIDDLNMYILTNQTNFEIICLSKLFYDMILQKAVQEKQIPNVSLSKLIPALKLIFLKFQQSAAQNSNPKKDFSTIGIKPSNKEELKKINKLNIKQENITQLIDYNLFIIKGEMFSINNQFLQVVQFKITDLVQLNDSNTKIEELQNLHDFYDQNNSLFNQYQENSSQLIDQIQSNSSPIQTKNQTKILQDFSEIEVGHKKNQQLKETLIQQEKLNKQKSNELVLKYSQDFSGVNIQNEVSQLYQTIDLQNENQRNNELLAVETARNSQVVLFSPQNSFRELLNQQQSFYPTYNDRDQSYYSEEKITIGNTTQRILLFQNPKHQSTLDATKQSETQQIDYLKQQSKNSSGFLHQQLVNLQSKLYLEKEISNTELKQISIQESTMKQSFSNQLQQLKIRQDIQIDGSIHTSQSGRTAFRKSIIENIKSDDKFTGLIIMKLAGGIALICFLALNITNFYTLHQKLTIQKEDYSNIDWGSKVKTTLSQLICDQSMQKLLNVQYFKPPQDKYQEIISSIKKTQIQRYETFKGLVLKYLNSDKQKTDLYQIVIEKNNKFAFGFSPTRQYFMDLKFGYVQEAIYGYMYQVSYVLDPTGMNELQISYNYVNTADNILLMYEDVNNKINNSFNAIIDQAFLSMMVVMITTIIFSLSFIPIYAFIQQKREEILILFTTFSPEKLAIMLQETMNSISLLEFSSVRFNKHTQISKKQQLKNDALLFSNNFMISDNQIDTRSLIKKKKNISTTNHLPKFNFKVIIFALIFFILTQIHTIASYILIRDFIDTEKVNREFINGLFEIVDYTAALNIVRTPLILLNLAKNPDLLKLYMERAEYNYNLRTQQLNNLYDLIQRQYSVTRFRQQEFNDYVLEILEGNACKKVGENLDLLREVGFTEEKCNGIANGIFTSGLVKTVKYNIDLYVSRMPVYYEKNLTTFLKKILIQEQDLNTEQGYFMRVYTFYIANTVYEKVARMTYDHYDLMTISNYILVVISFFTFIFAMYLAYYKFFFQSMNQLKQTKLLLDIIDIHALEENQYILTYFRISK